MKNCLTLHGIDIELTEEQIAQIESIVTPPKKDIFNPSRGEIFYYITDTNLLASTTLSQTAIVDKHRINAANCCTDKTLMQKRALHETLMRQLWRFQMQHRDVTPQNCNRHYEIIIETEEDFKVTDISERFRSIGALEYPTQALAQQAIDEIIKPFLSTHPTFSLKEDYFNETE